MHEETVLLHQPGRGAFHLGQGAGAQIVVQGGHGRVQLRAAAHSFTAQRAAQLAVVIADQEQPAALVDQPEHQPQSARTVRPAIDQVAELDDEPVGIGGKGECAQIAMHVTDHAQATPRRDGHHARGSSAMSCSVPCPASRTVRR